jgi:DNA-directed RNA polymerase subunit RPC12/RpoP
MKYKCLVCGQIIDNNEMCPFCGSDSSQIVPIDFQGKKGHFRCLVCGRETENGDYCPYCGSQRLYNLDTKKAEDTSSIEIPSEKVNENEGNEVNNEENHEEAQFGAESDMTTSVDVKKEDESNEEVPEDSVQEENNLEEEVPNEQTGVDEESLESRYFKIFGEMLPLDSIKNPDPEKVNALYRIGINRGEKISPDEIAKFFYDDEPKEEEIDEEIPVEPIIEKPSEEVKEVEKEVVETKEEPIIQPLEQKVNIKAELLLAITTLITNEELDDVSYSLLESLSNEISDEVKSSGDEKERILSLLNALVEEDKKNGDAKLSIHQKYLDLFKVLFSK